MTFMFDDAYEFDQSVDSFDTQLVTSILGMFRDARTFDQPLDKFDTSNVDTMAFMFYGASKYNQHLGKFDNRAVGGDVLQSLPIRPVTQKL